MVSEVDHALFYCVHRDKSLQSRRTHFTKPGFHISNLVELSLFYTPGFGLRSQQGAQLEIASIVIIGTWKTTTTTRRSPINNVPQIDLGVGQGDPEQARSQGVHGVQCTLQICQKVYFKAQNGPKMRFFRGVKGSEVQKVHIFAQKVHFWGVLHPQNRSWVWA